MFRSDRDALAGKVDDLRAENERLRAQNEAMRADLLARRAATPEADRVEIYRANIAALSAGERAALSVHSLKAFPLWATAALHVATFGVFSLVHFNLMHDRLPKAHHKDPTAAKGIGFTFIPYFHFYWIVFNTLRLTDRINLQFRLRGKPDAVPRALAILVGVLSMLPYVQFVTAPIAWAVMALFLQRAVNRLVEMRDTETRREVVSTRVDVPGMRIDAAGTEVDAEEIAQAEAEVVEIATRRRRE
ncbi:MAG: hypothetical protein QM820_42110 [Minicystis sp.]